MSLSQILQHLTPAFDSIAALAIEKKLVLLAGFFGVFTAFRAIGQIAWPTLRRHGFTYEIFRLAIGIAIILALIQTAALAGEAFLELPIDLIWLATGFGAVIVAAGTVHAYYRLKHRPTFSLHKLIAMFALQLSPVGAYFSWTLLRRGLLPVIF